MWDFANLHTSGGAASQIVQIAHILAKFQLLFILSLPTLLLELLTEEGLSLILNCCSERWFRLGLPSGDCTASQEQVSFIFSGYKPKL